MMRTEFPEEATTLLEEQAVSRRMKNGKRVGGSKRVADKKSRRSLRVVVGAVAVVGVLVGCVAAIDMAAMRNQAETNAEMHTHADEVGYGLTTDLEAQTANLSWSSFSNSWCKVRSAFVSYTYCLVTSDRSRCQEEAYEHCAAASNSTSSDGSGSGYGSGTGSW